METDRQEIYKHNRQFSDQFIRPIQRILTHYLQDEDTEFVEDFTEDVEHATDLLVLRGASSGLRVACRVREFKYLRRYGKEFTIRCDVPTGMRTEFEKIMQGWGDYIFYAIADRNNKGFASALIGDLAIFRAGIKLSGIPRSLEAHRHLNKDGTEFYAFRIDEFPAAFNKILLRNYPF